MPTRNLFFVHWNEREANALADKLTATGYDIVGVEHKDGKRACDEVKRLQPDIVVISLRRLPSHGRETALHLRRTKATSDIPIVFFDGDPEKVENIRQKVPHATYASFDDLPKILQTMG